MNKIRPTDQTASATAASAAMVRRLDRPIFVVGNPRSGNTLLSSLLSSSSDLVVTPEIHFLTYWLSSYRFLNLSRDRDFRFFVKQFTRSQRFGFLQLDPETTARQLNSLQERNFKSVFEEVLESYRAGKDRPRVGEKTPGQFAHVETLLGWFPDARIVWIVRDPRAVVASLLSSPFASPVVSQKAVRWKQAQNKLLSYADEQRVLSLIHI